MMPGGNMSEQRASDTFEPADQCPRWCVRDHSAELRGTAFYHASETTSVTISWPRHPGVPERVDVQTPRRPFERDPDLHERRSTTPLPPSG